MVNQILYALGGVAVKGSYCLSSYIFYKILPFVVLLGFCYVVCEHTAVSFML